MSNRGNYLIVQEDILRDDKIRDLIEAKGFEGFGIYISILTLMRNYQESGYKVPWSETRKIARWDLLIPNEKLKEVIDACIDCGLFKSDDSFFWSERRVECLVKQDDLERKRSETNQKNIRKRWEKKEQ